MPYRLGIVATHPIQYQVPWFREMAKRPEIDLTVVYCMLPDARQQGAGFGVEFQWDVPLLQGYEYEVADNVAKDPSSTRFLGCDTPGIGALIRKRHFDAVLVNGWAVKSCLQVLQACRRQGLPCMVRGESNALRRRKPWVRLFHRLLLSRYAACLAIGKANRQFYVSNGVPKRKIFRTPYSVDNDRFARQAEAARLQRKSHRAKWSIPRDAIVFLFCGKFIRKKRPHDLLDALARALPPCGANVPQIHLLMVGDGELRQRCEQTATRLGLPVSFAGFLNQNDIVTAYVASDCLVLPSDHGETWGLVVNEAFACGLPAIVSNAVGCHPDLIVEAKTGFTFPLGDVQALASAMVAAASDSAKLRSMGRCARKHIRAYTIAHCVAGTLDALACVCRSKPSASPSWKPKPFGAPAATYACRGAPENGVTD